MCIKIANEIRKKTLITSLWFVFVLSVIVVDGVDAASFDCVMASTSIERLICSDKELSRLDAVLSVEYKEQLKNISEKESFTAEQRDWLRLERDACLDVDCLIKSYKKRIRDIEINGKLSAKKNKNIEGNYFRMVSNREKELCGFVYELLKAGRITDLSVSLGSLLELEGVKIPVLEAVNVKYFWKISREPFVSWGVDSDEYKKWEELNDHRKYFLAEINYDNSGDNEYVLSYEVTNGAGKAENFRGRYHVMQDKNTLYEGYKKMNWGRLFVFKNIYFILDANGDDIVAIYRKKTSDHPGVVFGTETVCIMER